MLKTRLAQAAKALGAAAMGVTHTDFPHEAAALGAWLTAGWHGEMDYMAKHAPLRAAVTRWVPEAQRVLMFLFPYWTDTQPAEAVLADPTRGYVSRYALGRDYHKVVRGRLLALERQLTAWAPQHRGRVCVDSAPLFEVAAAVRAGLGWRGKHTLLLTREGSYFFLGALITNLPLPIDDVPVPLDENAEMRIGHCGRCTRCLDACPTGAIVAPYRLDARRCISYLTIEHPGSIPEPLRPLIGNRIYGCDDCQLVCPWNRFARLTPIADFSPRHGLDAPSLVELFSWDEATFLARTEGSAIRRIGWERWLRNLAVALGNAPTRPQVIAALRARADHPSPLVREHVAWALRRHG